MPEKPPFSKVVAGLPPTVPFVPPEELERKTGTRLQLRLGANESTFGMSPHAREAMAQAAAESNFYGDAHCYPLRQELARLYGVDGDHLVFASGIDELLGLIARAFLNPGDGVTTSLGGYPTFNYHVEGFGGIIHEVPYQKGKNDLEGLSETAAKTGSRIVYLANPDNPTGTWYSAEELADFRASLPADCLLLLDEAYIEFAPKSADLPIDPSDRGIIRTRTFSKVYGMAGARIGYALTHPEIARAFDKIRNHFGVNHIAQAGALAALQDSDFVQKVVASVEQGRREYEELAQSLGFTAYPSATNFVAIDVGSEERAVSLREALWERGVFVRTPGAPPLNRCLRVTVGTPEERTQFAAILRETVQALSKS